MCYECDIWWIEYKWMWSGVVVVILEKMSGVLYLLYLLCELMDEMMCLGVWFCMLFVLVIEVVGVLGLVYVIFIYIGEGYILLIVL